jgi:hypothetical protein
LFTSSHGRGNGHTLEGNLGSKFDVCSIFKPNSPLVKDVEGFRKLNDGLIKQDHVVGGPGYIAHYYYYHDDHHHHSIRQDINSIAERKTLLSSQPTAYYNILIKKCMLDLSKCLLSVHVLM